MRKQELNSIMLGSVIGDADMLYTVDGIDVTLFANKEYKGNKSFRTMAEAMRKSGKITIKLVDKYRKSKVISAKKLLKYTRV